MDFLPTLPWPACQALLLPNKKLLTTSVRNNHFWNPILLRIRLGVDLYLVSSKERWSLDISSFRKVIEQRTLYGLFKRVSNKETPAISLILINMVFAGVSSTIPQPHLLINEQWTKVHISCGFVQDQKRIVLQWHIIWTPNDLTLKHIHPAEPNYCLIWMLAEVKQMSIIIRLIIVWYRLTTNN